jgi:hypothetical protein
MGGIIYGQWALQAATPAELQRQDADSAAKPGILDK